MTVKGLRVDWAEVPGATAVLPATRKVGDTPARPRTLTMRWDSLADLETFGRIACDTDGEVGYGHADRYALDRNFAGVGSYESVEKYVREGWRREAASAIDLAEGAVSKVEMDHPVPVFEATYDVTGGAVDIGRYLAGEPECMVDMPLVERIQSGPVITLVSSVSASSGINKETIKARGRVVAALALALSDLGYGVEIWADNHVSGGGFFGQRGASDVNFSQRVRVKSTDEVIDASRIMYALAHPSVLRVLMFNAYHGVNNGTNGGVGEPGDAGSVGVTMGKGCPLPPFEDMPAGTIYLPCLRSDRDPRLTDAAEVENHLRALGILPMPEGGDKPAR